MTEELTDEPSHLGLTRRSAGRIMVVIAYVGVVSALVGAVVGWQFLGELSNANKQGLVLAGETLSAVDTSLDVANDVVDAVDDALAALSSTVLAVGGNAARHDRSDRQRPRLARVDRRHDRHHARGTQSHPPRPRLQPRRPVG